MTYKRCIETIALVSLFLSVEIGFELMSFVWRTRSRLFTGSDSFGSVCQLSSALIFDSRLRRLGSPFGTLLLSSGLSKDGTDLLTLTWEQMLTACS